MRKPPLDDNPLKEYFIPSFLHQELLMTATIRYFLQNPNLSHVGDSLRRESLKGLKRTIYNQISIERGALIGEQEMAKAILSHFSQTSLRIKVTLESRIGDPNPVVLNLEKPRSILKCIDPLQNPLMRPRVMTINTSLTKKNAEALALLLSSLSYASTFHIKSN